MITGVEARRKKLCWVARHHKAGSIAVAVATIWRAAPWAVCAEKAAASHTFTSSKPAGTLAVLLGQGVLL